MLWTLNMDISTNKEKFKLKKVDILQNFIFLIYKSPLEKDYVFYFAGK